MLTTKKFDDKIEITAQGVSFRQCELVLRDKDVIARSYKRELQSSENIDKKRVLDLLQKAIDYIEPTIGEVKND